ncbi:histidine kinase [Salisediminibacterium halotolerans]|uniref:histidine kinase n=1 Tax=Salisediminibacterium halotolerans TaxID=517425 RepID=A0A1H9U7J4_9BACI|nr:histidine kinase [Salisediminibacterium haloalkalitolerans]SES05550.1 Histidine kinase-, DNA gyrase B-, and HSP90-like ATPase [Salisediminibacterium haloalkalitolerans]
MRRIILLIKQRLVDLSVKTKIIGMVAGLVVLMGGASVFFTTNLLSANLHEDLERRAVSVANDLSGRSEPLLMTQDIYQMNQQIEETLEHHPDVEYIFILDESGETVIDTFGPTSNVSEELLRANGPEAAGEEMTASVASFESENGPIHDVAAPIADGDEGVVRVGMNETMINETMYSVLLTIIMVTIGTGLLGLLIAYALMRILYRDVSQLMTVSQAVADGDYSANAQVTSKDEMGRLSQSFNYMIERLNVKKQENEEFTRRLQLKNRELTVLHDLSIGVSDSDAYHKYLYRAAQMIQTELKMDQAEISVDISGEPIRASAKTEADPGETAATWSESIVRDGEEIGYVTVAGSGDPDGEGRMFLRSFVRQLAVISENVELWNEVRYREELRLKLLNKVITAQEEERKRIARELHDETSQSITSLIVGLSLLELSALNQHHMEKIREMKRNAQRTLDEVHYISWSLRPSVLDDHGLVPAIRRYAEEFANKYGVEVDVHVIGLEDRRLSGDVEVTVYRVIQEALTNVARHAKAEEVSILLRNQHDKLDLIIEDDGKGFDTAALPATEWNKDHLGMKGMQERIESIGGRLVVESGEGHGTTLYVKGIETGRYQDERIYITGR